MFSLKAIILNRFTKEDIERALIYKEYKKLFPKYKRADIVKEMQQRKQNEIFRAAFGNTIANITVFISAEDDKYKKDVLESYRKVLSLDLACSKQRIEGALASGETSCDNQKVATQDFRLALISALEQMGEDIEQT